jgi:hypothetical protein
LSKNTTGKPWEEQRNELLHVKKERPIRETIKRERARGGGEIAGENKEEKSETEGGDEKGKKTETKQH